MALAVLLVAQLLFSEKIKQVTFSMGLSSWERSFFLKKKKLLEEVNPLLCPADNDVK